MTRIYDVVVIGAGIAGLSTALMLHEAGLRVQVIEARNAPGGRIRSVKDPQSGTYMADLGPSWIWPAYQPVIRRWMGRLGCAEFAQYTTGVATLDRGTDHAPLYRELPAQEGSRRIVGGPQALIDALILRLPQGIVRYTTPVTEVAITATGDMAITTATGEDILARRIVVSAPPRRAHQIKWPDALPGALMHALADTPTWMAPHAKAVAIYEHAFWRKRGLSGRIASQTGPLVEAHDHCGAEGTPAAIFGFVGWPHEMRAATEDLTGEIITQLNRCFGPDAPAPLAVHIEDWAADRYTATAADLAGPMAHPVPGPQIIRQPHLEGRVIFANAETASRSTGLIEGAFDAAETAVKAYGIASG